VSQTLGATMPALPSYVIVTPARNEAQFIEPTIKSVLAQTIRPLKWVIVSDGSTDGMDDIVRKYAAEHAWIELLRMPERRERHFAGKVHAFNAGYARLVGLPYEVIVNLDADVSFGEDYFSFLLQRLAEDSQLGLVAGRLVDVASNQSYNYEITGNEYVSGPCQVFRRECFEVIGGYRPLKSGGVDVVAVLSARASGWQTRAFTEKPYHHHRPMNGAQMKGVRERLHTGKKAYLLGSHPVWEIVRSVYVMGKRPYVIGGILIFIGYFWSFFCRVERTIPRELMKFRHRDQMARLKTVFRRFALGSIPTVSLRGHKAAGTHFDQW
jgi:poly-beta-1,6-N-acetyl-D-glucosamine synthase